MYRDRAHEVDEHDRAVGAILIGETLTAECERAAARFRDPLAPDRWTTLRDAQDAYPEIWRQLDRASKALSRQGITTAGYEQLRAHVRPQLVTGDDDLDQDIDLDAIDDARRAIAELKLAIPGVDWKGIDQRTSRLVETRELRRRRYLPTAAVIVFLVLCGVSWELASLPQEAPTSQRERMRQELAEVALDRQENLTYLEYAVESACYAPHAREYTKLLVYEGRRDDARTFADRYAARCGADDKVERWANAPQPRRR